MSAHMSLVCRETELDSEQNFGPIETGGPAATAAVWKDSMGFCLPVSDCKSHAALQRQMYKVRSRHSCAVTQNSKKKKI